jgi:hypothetical protein
VAGAKRNPPPPYLLILPMQKVGDHWKLSDVLPNWLRVRRHCSAWLLIVLAFAFCIVAATSARADVGSGSCNVVKDPTCTVGTGTGGHGASGGGGAGSSADPCAAYPDAIQGDTPAEGFAGTRAMPVRPAASRIVMPASVSAR